MKRAAHIREDKLMQFRLIIAAFIIALAVAVSPQGVFADDTAPSQNKDKQEQLKKLGTAQGTSPWTNKDKPKLETSSSRPSKKRLPKFQLPTEQNGSKGFADGFELETPPIEYRDGMDNNNNKTKQPGLAKYSNVTLKRGVFNNRYEFFEQWKKEFLFNDNRDQRAQIRKRLKQENQEK